MLPKIEPSRPDQESVWDYPRPPRLEPVTQSLRVVAFGEVIAETNKGYRVLETSHPPVYYFPPGDCRLDRLPSGSGQSFCEYKGAAKYVDLMVPGQEMIEKLGWYYTDPPTRFAPIARHIAFYAGKVDACYVGDVQVIPQPGGFYGGWITPELTGPFKGIPGSMGW